MSNIKITAIVAVKAEHRTELLDVFTALVGESRKESGNLRYDLHQDLQNPNRFVFFENWKDQAAVDSHNASVHFQNFLKALDGKTEAVDIVLMKDVSDNGN
ncbi:putative quinol monooxygenase [Neisseria elongata]|uniref:putative quinol monooxygenase n=1 Tax=Neisseria elongata TaxID=495 RepID=UPI00361599F5